MLYCGTYLARRDTWRWRRQRRWNDNRKCGEAVNGRGQILALTSSKGGVGKTHLAVSLSAALAKRYARVLLIDADLGNGIIADRIGFSPRHKLSHFFVKEKGLTDLIEETPFGFFLISGEQGNLALANLNYLQEMKFLRSFFEVSSNFDFVVLDLASGMKRQAIDFALLAERTIIVTSPHDLVSAYGSMRGCFSRFMHLEATLFKRIEDYTVRQVFKPHILLNHVNNLYQGETAFEALENAVKSRLGSTGGNFNIRMVHLGSVFHDPELFRKAEEQRCPASEVSAYTRVAFCVDSMATVICSRSPFRGFYREEGRLRYILEMLMEQQQRLRKGLTPKVTRVPSMRIPVHH
jgi:MinD-like ATPase involved in chromosome partitioning or flagellar assembly